MSHSAGAMLLAVRLIGLPVGEAQPLLQPTATKYSTFREVRLVLSNSTRVKLFLQPTAVAYLERWNEVRREWEAVGYRLACGVGEIVDKPKKATRSAVKPGHRMTLAAQWEAADIGQSADGPEILVGSGWPRPVAGRYRAALLYSLEPWSDRRPEKVLQLVSTEFDVRGA
jgi:hypothetical protein